MHTTRKKKTNPTLINMFKIFKEEKYLGLPVYRSLAKGITLSVSNATINITHKIYSGWSDSSRKTAILSVSSHNNPVSKTVDKIQVLYTLGSACCDENRK